jgi:hypothetical protein
MFIFYRVGFGVSIFAMGSETGIFEFLNSYLPNVDLKNVHIED